MTKVKDGFFRQFSSKIGDNDYLLKAGGGYIGVGSFALAGHDHDDRYLKLSGGTLTGNLSFSNSGTGFRGINYGTMGDNDQWRIGGAATGSNGGYMEIATADDGTEPIYVRQYTGVFSSLTRTATLLDASGNTSFPGSITGSGFIKSGYDNTYILQAGGGAKLESSLSVGYSSNSDKVDDFHITMDNSEPYKNSFSITYPTSSMTDGYWYVKINMSRYWCSGITRCILYANYSNTCGQTYLDICEYPGYFKTASTSYCGNNVVGIATTGSVPNVFWIKLVKPVQYEGSIPDGSFSILTPGFDCTLSAQNTAPDGINFIQMDAGKYYDPYLFTGFTSNGNYSRLTIGGVTKDLIPPYSYNADKLDGYHFSDLESRYVNVTGDMMTGQLYINLDEDVGLNQNGSLVIGSKTGGNIGIDGNEIMARNNGSAATLYLQGDGGNLYSEAGTNYFSGNVGIGTTSPSYKLDVNSSARVKGNLTIYGDEVYSNGKGLYIMASDSTHRALITWNGNTSSTDYLNLYTIYGNINLNPAYYVGIGTYSPSYKLHVEGSIYSSSGFVKGSSSDSYVLLGAGGHKLESNLSVAYAQEASYLNVTLSADVNTCYKDAALKLFYNINTNSGYAGTNYGFPCSNNANAVLWIGAHSGVYGGQLGISSNNELYYRYITAGSFSTTENGGSWKRILNSSNYSEYVYSKSTSDDRYVYKSGDTMTGSLKLSNTSTNHIQFLSSDTYSGATNEYMSIGKGRIQSWGSIYINADTDDSTNEYCLITSGHGVSTSNADGLAVGYNTLLWKNNTIWHAGNDGSGSGLDADTVDSEHASSFAHRQTWNNMIHSSNEYTWVSPAYSGEVYINYRTSSGSCDGNITMYRFCDGKGGMLAYISSGFFGGTASNADTLDGYHYNGLPYLPIGGGTMTGTPYINMPASAASISNSQPFGITYGRIQGYGNINIAADTDGSTGEYVIITSGYGISSATNANGLAIGYNSLTWKNNTIWHAGNDGSGSGLEADYLDGYHHNHLIPYRYTYGTYTNSGSSDWYLRLTTGSWISEDALIFVRGGGDNCSSDMVLHVLCRENKYWGWQTSYNGVRVNGIAKSTEAGEIIYLKMPGSTTSISISSTFGLSISQADYSSVSYQNIGNEGMFTNFIQGRIQNADWASYIDWSGVNNKPSTATRWPSWDEVTSKPSTFTPSSHTHDSLYVNSVGGLSNLNDATGEYYFKYFRFQAGASNQFSVSNNANAVVWVHRHGGTYGTQLGFSSNGNFYYRNADAGSWGNWRRIAFADEIPTSTSVTVTNSAPSLGKSAKTIATIGGTAITASVGDSDKWDGYHLVVGSTGSDSSTIYILT